MARRLLAISPAARGEADLAHVFDRLRIPLSKLVGDEGYSALLRRALALARAELPSLRDVTIGKDGQLVHLNEVPRGGSGDGSPDEPVIAIAAQLLGLLVTFIGEPLTLQLLRETWPNVSLDE